MAAVFTSVFLLTGSPHVNVFADTPGLLDMSDFNFTEDTAYIDRNSFVWYPGTLLKPEDFSDTENLPEAGNGDEDFGTCRLTLRLPAGAVYGLSGYSASYSQRIWVDGVEYPAVGMPGATLEETTPKTNYYTVYFTATGVVTEIVIQRAGFVHYKHGRLSELFLGGQERIIRHNQGTQMGINIVVGSMLMSAIYFFGLYLFFQKRHQFLWFALACLMVLLRTLTIEGKMIRVLLPDLNWYVAIGLEYLSFIGLVVCLILYANRMYGQCLHRYMVRFAMVFCLGYALVVVLTKPSFYGNFIVPFQYMTGLFGIYFIVCMAYSMVRKKQNRYPEHFLIVLGILAFVALGIPDISIHQSREMRNIINLTQIGMMVCVFANMIALTLSFIRTETELEQTRQNERALAQTNEMLDSLNRIKSDFMGNISHEMKTPLTRMGSYAGVTLRQIKKNAVTVETEKNLDTIQREAVRLGLLVERMKEVALEKERQLTLTETDAQTLLQRAADFCAPICQENKNRITVYTDPERIPLLVNAGDIFQVLFNLITNANRHTRNGEITVNAELRMQNAELGHGEIVVSVSDTGDGISPELLASVFERGVSGDGGTGLGLAICKEIVEEHGGTITVESEPGKGTTVRVLLMQN